MLNNYLINSDSVASHCHPNDLPAWIVTNHDLCGWDDHSNNCSVPPRLFRYVDGARGAQEKKKKKLYKIHHCSYYRRITILCWGFDCGSLHIYFLNIIVLYWIFFEGVWNSEYLWLKRDLYRMDTTELNSCFVFGIACSRSMILFNYLPALNIIGVLLFQHCSHLRRTKTKSQGTPSRGLV